jgi:phosphatidylinositol alpha-1,6-mannosyltransferase
VDVCVANSRNTGALFRSFAREDSPTVCFHPCVDSRFFTPTDDRDRIREQVGLSGDPILLTVGRLEERKGQDLVIRALPALTRRLPDVSYVMLGDGETKDELLSLAESLSVSDRIKLIPECDAEVLVDLYRSADLFVMPNKRLRADLEGFGIVYLEAAACGVPSIGGRSGGVPEAVEHGRSGYLCSPGSLEDFTAKALELLTDRQKAQAMGAYGRERVLRDFRWEQNVPRLCRELLG